MVEIAVATPEAYDLFHQGTQELARVTANGIRIDVPYLDNAIRETTAKIAEYEKRLKADKVWRLIVKDNGDKAKLCNAQIGRVVFDRMGYEHPGTKTAKGKKAKYDFDVLKDVDLPFVKDYLRMDDYRRLKGTFLEGIKAECVDGFVHPQFHLNFVETMRSSGSEPNVQNQWNRDEEMSKILRRCYIPRKKGWRFAEIDYAAQEFKGAAMKWADPKMMAYATDPTKDIHRDMAAKCYKCDPKQVDKKIRYAGKNGFVFPHLYGSYFKKIAPAMWAMIDEHKMEVDGKPMREHLASKGITSLGNCGEGFPQPGTFEHHIKGVEEWFDKEFHVFASSREKWWDDYRKRGWFRTMTGFVIRGIFSKNFLMNADIQGSSFHLLLWSLIEVMRELRKRRMETLTVAEIHDCQLGDGPEGELQDYLSLCEEVMTERVRKAWDWVTVPLSVEVDVTPDGGSWASKTPWAKMDGVWQPKVKSA